jgi:hypothetical protein
MDPVRDGQSKLFFFAYSISCGSAARSFYLVGPEIVGDGRTCSAVAENICNFLLREVSFQD